MNIVAICGRLTADADIETTEKNGKELLIANFTLALNRSYGNGADFVRCVTFGKKAEIVRDYFSKGQKMDARGHITTGSYKDKDGKTVYTTTITVDELEFGESKSSAKSNGGSPQAQPKDEPIPTDDDGFMKVDNVDDEGLPFNL